jgi:hypothetical protein
VVGAVGLWGQLEAAAAFVGCEDAVGVEVGQDALAELAQLAWCELPGRGDQLPFYLSDLFDRQVAGQLLDHPADLVRLLIR